MIKVEMVGGPACGLKGELPREVEVVLMRSEDNFVDAYEREKARGGVVIYRWARCVGKLGGPPAAVNSDGHRPPLQGEGGPQG